MKRNELDLSTLDKWLSAVDHGLRAVSGAVHASRPMPTPTGDRPPQGEEGLAADQRKLSGALMRINHVGEVCAQALYQAQALTARSPELRAKMLSAALEEADHLAWTHKRLQELDERPSLLNPLWYAGSFAIGLVAGRAGDRISLGFVMETERQVEQHLAGHLERLPAGDRASRVIVEQMRSDEIDHGRWAREEGGAELSWPVRSAMRIAARVMTHTAHHL